MPLASAKKHRGHVQGKTLVPLVKCQILQERRARAAGIVDKELEPGGLFADRLKQPFYSVFPCEVGAHRSKRRTRILEGITQRQDSILARIELGKDLEP